MDDQRLMAGYKRGDSWAQKEIYEKYAPFMLSLCIRYVKNLDDAQDLLQDGFVRVFTQADKFSATGTLGGWIRQIMINTALDFIRNRKKLDWNIQLEELTETTAENLGALQKMRTEDLMKCVLALPQVYRTVFNLYAIEGYSYAEISSRMNISEATVRTHYSRARKKLQIIVNELIENEK